VIVFIVKQICFSKYFSNSKLENKKIIDFEFLKNESKGGNTKNERK